ncbi:MAG: TRAM domain-containing protein, partial [Coriobacteriaceae bacterium]|nr:TRAM domain-containing protein [Coriobacteriaceae bacterium]
DRAQMIRDLCDRISESLVRQRVGEDLDVLVLGTEEDGQIYGRAMCQAPEVDGVVYLSQGEPGDVVRVRIHDSLMYEMEGW